MHEAKYYSRKDGKVVKCNLCPWNCVIREDSYGNCGVRKNTDGKLYSESYGEASSFGIDPIEKKPLFHFLPGTRVLSFGTLGCNLHCMHCQNDTISQSKPGEYRTEHIIPKDIVRTAVDNCCRSIAATYNEPTVFYEYMFDTFRYAKENNVKSVIVSNGYINPEPLKDLMPYLDAANIDLKGFSDKFYREITTARLKPVLRSLKMLYENRIWLEITNLIIPKLNDNLDEIKKMCEWIKENLSTDVPLHFTAFYPCYKLADVIPTSKEILIKARDVASKAGFKYVYIGNVRIPEGESTTCPECGRTVVERHGFSVAKYDLKRGKCNACNSRIDGVFLH